MDLIQQRKTVHSVNLHLVNPLLQQALVVVQHLSLVVVLHSLILSLQVLPQACLAIPQRHQHLDSQLVPNHLLEVAIYELFHLHVQSKEKKKSILFYVFTQALMHLKHELLYIFDKDVL